MESRRVKRIILVEVREPDRQRNRNGGEDEEVSGAGESGEGYSVEGEVAQVPAESESFCGLLSLPQPPAGAPSFHGGPALVPGRALLERYF